MYTPVYAPLMLCPNKKNVFVLGFENPTGTSLVDLSHIYPVYASYAIYAHTHKKMCLFFVSKPNPNIFDGSTMYIRSMRLMLSMPAQKECVMCSSWVPEPNHSLRMIPNKFSLHQSLSFFYLYLHSLPKKFPQNSNQIM